MIRMGSRGMTLVETLIVAALGVMILLPLMNFMLFSQKSATKGFDRIETLSAARLILEQVQRDLKALCFDDSSRFLTASDTQTVSYSFPAFPGAGSGPAYSGSANPVNLIEYSYEPGKRELKRTVTFNSLLPGAPKKPRVAVLAKNVVEFSISPAKFLGSTCYDIVVKCQSSMPKPMEAATKLRTSVRSEYQGRLQRHPNWIINRRTQIKLPP